MMPINPFTPSIPAAARVQSAKVGHWICNEGSTTTETSGSTNLNATKIHYVPIFIGAGALAKLGFSEMGVYVATGFTTGVAQFALYGSDDYGYPGTKIAEGPAANAVSIASSATYAPVAFAARQVPGYGKFWLAISVGNFSSVAGAIRAVTGVVPGVPILATPAGGQGAVALTEACAAWNNSGTFAAFPATATPTATVNAGPLLYLKSS